MYNHRAVVVCTIAQCTQVHKNDKNHVVPKERKCQESDCKTNKCLFKKSFTFYENIYVKQSLGCFPSTDQYVTLLLTDCENTISFGKHQPLRRRKKAVPKELDNAYKESLALL